MIKLFNKRIMEINDIISLKLKIMNMENKEFIIKTSKFVVLDSFIVKVASYLNIPLFNTRLSLCDDSKKNHKEIINKTVGEISKHIKDNEYELSVYLYHLGA